MSKVALSTSKVRWLVKGAGNCVVLAIDALKARICTSWHSSRRRNSVSGVSIGRSGARKLLSLSSCACASGLPNVASSCAKMSIMDIVASHLVSPGVVEAWYCGSTLVCRIL